jgi:hypothetical protein
VKYHFIDTLGDLESDYCVVTAPLEGAGLAFYRMAKGERMGDDYPDDARLDMDEDQGGIKVPAVIGNTQHYLIVAEAVKDALLPLCDGAEVEVLPVALFNRKKRRHPGRFFILNPIGARDCLDLRASEIEYLHEPGDPYDGAVVGVDRFVLDPAKLAGAPALFRVREEPERYVLDERAAQALRAGGFSNVVLTEIEQSR